MTAHDPTTRSARPRARALWRARAEAEPREVTVTLGERSIVLSDAADRPLAHWARVGLHAVGTRGDATLYAILDDGETLEIRDPAMIAALDSVALSFAPPPAPPPSRRRFPWIAVLLLLGLAALSPRAPDMIESQAARMMPPGQAREFGDRMLLGILDARGALCAEPEGTAALAAFGAAAAPGAAFRVLDLGGAALTAALPGPTVLIDRAALARASGPAELAGWVAQALGPEAGPEPGAAQVRDLMAAAGPLAGLLYIFTGTLSDAALSRATDVALAPPATPDVAPPAPAAEAFPAADWQALRGICG